MDGVTARQKLILLVLLLIVVNFGFYKYVYTGRAGEMKALSADVVRLQQSINTKKALVSDMEKIKRERAELQEKYTKILDRLPEEKEIPRLLRQVATVASRSGLEVVIFKQKNPLDQELYREIPVEVSINGAYQSLWGFLNQLSQIPRIVNVGELHAKAVENPDGRNAITASLVATVFQSHSKEGASESKPKARPAR
jgi:type IV pilus assembly protein PilO